MNTDSIPTKLTARAINAIGDWFTDRDAAQMLRRIDELPALTQHDVNLLCDVMQQVKPARCLHPRETKFLLLEEISKQQAIWSLIREEQSVAMCSHLTTQLCFLAEGEVARLALVAILANSQPATSNKSVWFNVR